VSQSPARATLINTADSLRATLETPRESNPCEVLDGSFSLDQIKPGGIGRVREEIRQARASRRLGRFARSREGAI
jgi:hypothetical protein